MRSLTAIGDRLLALLVPATTAGARVCAGRVVKRTAVCTWTCYRYSGGQRTTLFRTCDNGPCVTECSDCC